MRKQILLSLVAVSLIAAPASTSAKWIATWGTAASPQMATPEEMRAAKFELENQTVRQVVHVSAGGESVRVRLSNAFSSKPARIGAAHIALSAGAAAIKTGSDRALTFSGRSSIEIPANAVVISDPVKLSVAAGADLAISLFVPERTSAGGIHYGASQTNYLAVGDQTAKESFAEPSKISSWIYLAGVDVLAPAAAYTVVTFGDSITDGARSTPDTNHRWPDILASRLRTRKVGVVNAGIGGNRILHDGVSQVRFGVNALARFDRDVLAVPGVKYVIILEGINDIGHPGSSAPESEAVTAEDLIAAYKQIIERAHQKGIKVFGATILPFEGTPFKGYFSAEKEKVRKAVNEWIRTSKTFDGVVDFDKATRDPAHPDQIQAAYDGGDHLHPGDAGYKAMGEAVNLALFQ